MKTKQQLMDALTAKGVEFDPNAKKDELGLLALDNGIPLEVETDPLQPVADTALQDEEIIAAKVKAGLSLEAAHEVLARQKAEDAKTKG